MPTGQLGIPKPFKKKGWSNVYNKGNFNEYHKLEIFIVAKISQGFKLEFYPSNQGSTSAQGKNHGTDHLKRVCL